MGRDREVICDNVHSECKADSAPTEDEVCRCGECQSVLQKALQASEGPNQEAEQDPVHILRYTYSKHSQARPENSRRNCPISIAPHVEQTYTGRICSSCDRKLGKWHRIEAEDIKIRSIGKIQGQSSG